MGRSIEKLPYTFEKGSPAFSFRSEFRIIHPLLNLTPVFLAQVFRHPDIHIYDQISALIAPHSRQTFPIQPQQRSGLCTRGYFNSRLAVYGRYGYLRAKSSLRVSKGKVTPYIKPPAFKNGVWSHRNVDYQVAARAAVCSGVAAASASGVGNA